jgi:predicted enzyme related to lactoylglutathione lyase
MVVKGVDFVQYGVDDLARALVFYRDTLGLRVTGHLPDLNWAELDLGTTTLALIGPPRGGSARPGASGATAVALAVDDVDGLLAGLRQRGVRVIFGPIDTPVCRMGMIADSEGNHLIIHRRKDGSYG